MTEDATLDQVLLNVPPTAAPVSFDWQDVHITSQFVPVAADPPLPEPGNWTHRERTTGPHVLGARAGDVVKDVFSAPGVELAREVWTDAAHAVAAIRLTVVNQSATPIKLDTLVPLQCRGRDGLLLHGESAGNWEMVRQARFKNEIPTSVRPGRFDLNYAQASKGTTELGDTQAADGNSLQFAADSFCVVRPTAGEQVQSLLIGFLSQTGHLAHILVRTDRDRVELDCLKAVCEFDGCEVPAREIRTSQWTVLMVGSDAHDLVTDFANWVGDYHDVAPPTERPPSVLCSWQYYGPHFKESDLTEDLAHLEQDPVPFDVFLIDDCWNVLWGDWYPNSDWPSGMKAVAERISAAGYRPGIWTCPYLAKTDSQLAREHPDWLLRLQDGTLITFMMDGTNYVLDPTIPAVLDFLETLFRRLTFEYGFTYHKLDFMRAVVRDPQVRFCDRSVTRLEAYRGGLEAVRRGIGPDAYLSVCGGHYGGSLGLADSQRSGSDVASAWDKPPALPKLKQNILRTWMGRLWHVDPDAMMVRRRSEPINDSRHGFLSLGKFTDDEARTIAVNQYVGGGLVCLCEKFGELDPDRKSLYRHIIPSINSPSKPVDYFASPCASTLVTYVRPRCKDLEPWVTVAVINWSDEPEERQLMLTPDIVGHIAAETYLVFDFFEQESLGTARRGELIKLGKVNPHATKLLKIMPWDRQAPCFVATDLHFSAGGVEVSELITESDRISGSLDTPWKYPVRITAAFPDKEGHTLRSTVVKSGRRRFALGAGLTLFLMHVLLSVGLAATDPRLPALPPEPKPFSTDSHALFLAHFDGNTSEHGLAADYSRSDPVPVTYAACNVADGGRFGKGLRLSAAGSVQYKLEDVSLESYTLETWFRTDAHEPAWRSANTDKRHYVILGVYGRDKPDEGVRIDIYWHTLRISHIAGGDVQWQRVLSFGAGRWLTGSEHCVTVSFDGSGGDENSVLTVDVDGTQLCREQGLSPIRARSFTVILGNANDDAQNRFNVILSKRTDPKDTRFRTMTGVLDEVRISNTVRDAVDLSRPQWRGFLPGPNERCRVNQPVEVYFSKPLDPAPGAPVRLVDETAGNPVPCKGEHIGNGSVYRMLPDSPLPFEHNFRLEFETGLKQARDLAGNRLAVGAIPPQLFRTRRKGEAPRLLPLKFRNDNTHVTLEGMERMCEYMDAIEFSMCRIKDGWVVNHLDRAGKIAPADGGDSDAFLRLPKSALETDYATLAAIDFSDVTDGRLDPIPRCRDQYEVIRRWDKVIHLQVKMSRDMSMTEQKALLDEWLTSVDFDWSRFHSWHKVKEGVLPRARNSLYALAYPDGGARGAGFSYARDRGWPGFTNPEWVDQAETHGCTTWARPLTEVPGIQRLARLGMDYMQNNELAYKGNQVARKALYELHSYEDAGPPAVISIRAVDTTLPEGPDYRKANKPGRPLRDATVSAEPGITITFSTQIEARSLNYKSLRLTRAGDKDEQRIPLRIDADSEWTTFMLGPQQPLPAGDYLLRIGDGSGPVSVAGLALTEPRTISFHVAE